MPHLRCYEKGCASNHCTHCVLDSIKIGLNAYCQSYRKKNEHNKDLAAFEFEYAQDMCLASALDGHPVQCANTACRFQETGQCHQNHVRIDSQAQGAVCVTFEPR